MGFLSELTMIQRVGGAGVLVLLLVLLFVKQRQKRAAPAGDPQARPAGTKPVKAPKSGKKGLSFSRGRKSKESDTDLAAAEPKSAQGRMVPRLPASMGGEMSGSAPAGFDDASEPALAEPMAASTPADGLISEPGWPTPGEVWAAPEAAATKELAPVDEPADTFGGAEDREDAMDALTEASTTDDTSWATDEIETFDPASGWDASDQEAAAVSGEAAEREPREKEQEEFDWTSGDSWVASGEDAAEELATAEAAWEAPEEEETSWSDGADTLTKPAAAIEAAPAITTVADEPEFTVSEWAVPETPPAEKPAAEAQHDGAPIVWGPVDQSEELSVESHRQTEPPAQVVEAAMREPASESTAAAESWVEVEPVIRGEESTPEGAEVAPPAVSFDPPSEHDLAIDDASEPVRAIDGSVLDATYGAPMVVAGAAMADPVSRWASMAPGSARERVQPDPVSSWSRLRPGKTPAVNGDGSGANGGVHVVAPSLPSPGLSDVALALAPSAAPAAAWWDAPSALDSDPRRGRFALGGYALQPGHQVVSGVTFRDGVVPPPSHWVIGPVVGAVAPGTLVLEVDGCLNCRPEDLAVLIDPGFAPTSDGFSLRLAAAATGPFAMSGTYVIS